MLGLLDLRGSILAIAGVVLLATGCWGEPRYLQVSDARRLAIDLRIEFAKADDASNRAVMADTDALARSSAEQARSARRAARADTDALAPLLAGTAGLAKEAAMLDEFSANFARYETVDDAILDLAVQRSNTAAQRLSFGPARESADALEQSLEAVVRDTPPAAHGEAQLRALTATLALRKIQVLDAPHIAEADEAAMTAMEATMSALHATTEAELAALQALATPETREPLAAANAALARFDDTHAQILLLSRNNTNVRSLAMSLGEKHTLTVACDRALTSLSASLSADDVPSTR